MTLVAHPVHRILADRLCGRSSHRAVAEGLNMDTATQILECYSPAELRELLARLTSAHGGRDVSAESRRARLAALDLVRAAIARTHMGHGRDSHHQALAAYGGGAR